MHDLIARGVAAERHRQGLTQEQVALMFRSHGLRAWRKGTVGQLEAGLRKPRLDEVLSMARALSVTLDKLIPGGDDERIELGDDAEVSPRWIREMLSGDFYRDRPLEELPYERFPVDELMADALVRSQAEKTVSALSWRRSWSGRSSKMSSSRRVTGLPCSRQRRIPSGTPRGVSVSKSRR